MVRETKKVSHRENKVSSQPEVKSVLQIMKQKRVRDHCAGGLVRHAQLTGNTINIVNATQKTSNKMSIYSQ